MPSYRIFDYWEFVKARSWLSFFVVIIFMAITVVYDDDLENFFRQFKDNDDRNEGEGK